MTPGPRRCLYLALDKISDIALYLIFRKHFHRLSVLKNRWLVSLLVGSNFCVWGHPISHECYFISWCSHDASSIYCVIPGFTAILPYFFPFASHRCFQGSRAGAALSSAANRSAYGKELPNAASGSAGKCQTHPRFFTTTSKRYLGLPNRPRSENWGICPVPSGRFLSKRSNVQLWKRHYWSCHQLLRGGAARSHIDFHYNVELSSSLSQISPIDLCAVLGNQVENALDACKKIPNSQRRFIQVSICQNKSFVVIQVINSAHRNPFTADGRLVTNKEDPEFHGLGLKSIQDTVNKYNGYLTNSYQDHTFQSEALLCFFYNLIHENQQLTQNCWFFYW